MESLSECQLHETVHQAGEESIEPDGGTDPGGEDHRLAEYGARRIRCGPGCTLPGFSLVRLGTPLVHVQQAGQTASRYPGGSLPSLGLPC